MKKIRLDFTFICRKFFNDFRYISSYFYDIIKLII